jgi:hypothetical protein
VCEKKIEVLKRLRDRYKIDPDGTITNIRTGVILRYSGKQQVVCLWDVETKQNWQFSRMQLRDTSFCSICGGMIPSCEGVKKYCAYCQTKLEYVRNVIRRKKDENI